MVSKSFFESLEDIANERGIAIEKILEKVEVAMQIACKNSDVPYTGEIKMEYDLEKKEIKFVDIHYVVEEVDPEGPRGQVTVEEAKALRTKVKVGQVIKDKVSLTSFKRKAASLFKQNLLNELKSLEREEAFEFFKDKVGEILTARVVNVAENYVMLNLKRGVDVSISMKDCIPGEKFNIGEEKKVYVTAVEKTNKGPKIFLCRNSKEMVRKLFELNIPEIENGNIEIMGIARDPGNRTKVGVMSMSPNIDAKGSCVGPQGSRIKEINNILGGEKIDIFVWKSNPIDLIAEALTPARVLSVMTDEKEKKALVICSEDQFSLAIGKSGQNVKLAAFATGWKIDIKKLADAYEEGIKIDYNITY